MRASMCSRSVRPRLGGGRGRGLALLLATVLGLAGPAAAQQPQTGTVTGKVTDEGGKPLATAQVLVQGTQLGATTDAGGVYRITGVPSGSATVFARLIGHRPQTRTVVVPVSAAVTQDFYLVSDPLTLEAVVVTGTRTPERKIESSTALTTLNSAEVEERAPRSTADLLRAVPGFYVEASGGQVGNNLFARGLPADGSFRYVGLLEDGMPVYDATELSFVNADIFVRVDRNIDRIEALRGGNAALFGSNAPGGVIDFISKTGGPTFVGTGGVAAGTSGMNRYDFDFNGPLAPDWRFNVGGFYRYDQGVRDPGFPSSRGGQIKANITRNFEGGFVRLYTKYMDDRNIFYLPLPIQGTFDANGKLTGTSFVTGFPDDGTLTSREGIDLRVPLPRNNGDLILPLDNGQRQVGGSAQLQLNVGIGPGWTLDNRIRYMNIQHQWNAMVPNQLVDAATWADSIVAATPGGAAAALTCTNVLTSGAPTPWGSAACPAENNLLNLAGEWRVDLPMTSLADQLLINKELRTSSAIHRLTLGGYFSHYTADNHWYFNNILTDVRTQPHFIDLTIINAADAPVRQVTDQGFRHYLDLFVNGTGNVTFAAAFAGDEIQLGDALRIDLEGRYEHDKFESDVENNTTYNLNPTDAGTAVNYGTGTFQRVNTRFDDWAASIGVNYKLAEETAIYARGTRGYKMPILSNYLFATDPSDPSFPNKAEQVLQAEGGLKYGSPKVGLSLVGYWLQNKNFPSQDVRIVNGVTTFVSAFVGKARTFGAELEVVAQPIDYFRLNASVTAQDPKYTDFFETGTDAAGNPIREDRSGNQVRRIPRFITDVTGTFDYRVYSLRANFNYIGHRFSNNANTIDLPGFGTLNLGASAGLPIGLTFEVNALNVTNSEGLTEGNPRLDESLGGLATIFLARPVLPRTFTAGVRYDF